MKGSQRPGRPRASRPESVGFEIEHIDPLGQGVSKQGGTATFVPATLPGETGTALVHRRAKGVQFARLQRLDRVAANRVTPECPHFERCPGCQFLHTDYASELAYKKATLARYLLAANAPAETIETVPAPRRLGYRNRVQLHYRHRYIGMLDTVEDEILPVPGCRILSAELQAEFDRLYRGEWYAEHKGSGHCELYARAGGVSVRWNESYAHGGFSQVNDAMNRVLQARVQALLEGARASTLLDLFCGAGNLSEAFAAAGGERFLIDNHAGPKDAERPQNFCQMDLYDERALPGFMAKSGLPDFDVLLVDPPRRGFPGLESWLNRIRPAHLLYVSCNPASLARDLRSLGQRLRYKSIQLLDLFPATAHFETLVLLQLRTHAAARKR